MTINTPISELMTLNPVVLAPNDTMDKAEKLFDKHGIHHLPVVEDGRLIGMVAFTDYLKIVREIFGGKEEDLKNKLIKESIIARDCMAKEHFSLNPEDSLGDAIHLFREKRVIAIPIVKEGQLVGILTALDMFGALEKLLLGLEDVARAVFA